MAQSNLELNVERRSLDGADVARICVASACSYTRHAAAPTLTADCLHLGDLRREVERLKGELDAALEQAAERMGERAAQREPAPTAAEAAAEAAAPAWAPRRGLGADLTVADAMTADVKTLGPNDHVSLVDELMKQGRFRHVVVVDDDGKVAGVVSRRDITTGAIAWSMGLGAFAYERTMEATPVKEVMQTRVVTVRPDAPLATAAELLVKHKFGCLPVLDGEQLVGILTEGDFLSLVAGS